MAVRRGVAGVLAALLLVLIVTSSLATVLTLTGRSLEYSREALESSAERARDIAVPPALSLEASSRNLVATVISQSPAEVKWFVVERADGSVEVKPGGRVHGATRFTLSTNYNCQPVRVYMILASGAAVAYDPRNDPLIARMPEGWDGWWTCDLPKGDQSSGRWGMIDPSRIQPVKASGGGGNDTVEYNIPPVRVNFVGNTVQVDRVHREAVPRLGGFVTVSLRGELVPITAEESLLVLRMTGPSNNTFFTGNVSVYIRVRGFMVTSEYPRCRGSDVMHLLRIFPVVYTPNGVVTKIRAHVEYLFCSFEYEMRYRVSLVDSNVVSMAYVMRWSPYRVYVQEARYEVNVTLVKAKVVDVKPTVYSLGSPGWVRLQLLNYTVVHDPITILTKIYSIPPWVGFIWPGTTRVSPGHQLRIDYGGNPQVTVVVDAGGGLSKSFALTPRNPLTLSHPGEVKIVVTPRPEPPFNDPYVFNRTDPTPIFAPWRAPAIILAEYAGGRREIIVISPTGHVTVAQGDLVFTGYGQLLGGLPFTYTPQSSRLAVYNGGLGGVISGPGSWLSQPVLQVANAYRVIAVIPDDRFRTGYVVVWVN